MGSALVASLAVLAAACSSTTTGTTTTTTAASAGSGSSSVTVTPSMSATRTSCATPSSCFVSGNVATISGIVPGLFKGALVGTDAYLAYQNSLGGLDGRKFKLISQDDAFSCDNNKAETQSLIQQGVIALTGSFSLEDNCGGQIVKQHPTVPDVSVTLDPTTAALPNVVSPQPLAQGMATGPLNYFKQKFPSAYKHVGTLVANAGSAPAQWAGEQAVMKQQGYDIVYQREYGPFETDFTPDILKMQQDGVQMVVLIAVDQNITSRFLAQAHQQGWHPQVIWGGASTYTTTMVSQAGGASVADGFYLEQASALFLGQDSASVPEVSTFLKWVHGLYPGFVPDLFTLYGWTSAQLYVQGLKGAGANPTSSSLLASLKHITSFDAGGMLAPANPAGDQPAYCYLLAKVVNGDFQRVDMPKTGFRCDGHYQHAS